MPDDLPERRYVSAVTTSAAYRARLDALNAACLSIVGRDVVYSPKELVQRAEVFRGYLENGVDGDDGP
jgi:hypothetical protein